MKRIANSKNYDVVFCPLCNKNRELPELDNFNGCIKCGGFGFIMKEKGAARIRKRSTRAKDRSAHLILRKGSIEDREPHDLS